MPPEIANAPDVPFGLGLFYEAFWELSSARTMGLAPGMIPWTVIHDYSRAHDFDEEQREDLFYYVRELDNAWLSYQQSKPPPRPSKAGTKWRPPKA